MSSDLSSVHSALQKPASPTRAAEIATPQPAPAVTQPQAASPQANIKLPSQADPAVMRRKLAEAIDHLNDMAQRNNYNLNFSVDDQSNQVVVRVRDAKSGEVIRQMPNEAALRMAQNLSDLKGLISDEKI